MKPFSLAINGMGRIGRNLFRLLLRQNRIAELKAVNDPMSKDNLIYLLKYDSIRGALNTEIISTEQGISIQGHEIVVLQEQNLSHLPWKMLGIDGVVEATGLFTSHAEAKLHLEVGAKYVLLTTFSKDIPSQVWGVNHFVQNSSIISPGDCTINCVAPVIHASNASFGIESIHINVIQGYTTRQELLDKPYKGLRRGRAAAHSIIPFEVGIAPILEKLFPSLENRIESMSTRVPVPCGAFAELSMILKQPTTAEEVNQLFLQQSKTLLAGTTSITFDPIVSSDIIDSPYSGLIDGLLTKVTNQNHVRMMIWFDNEWGYVNRLKDWIGHIAKK